jgi:uncharacterized protein (TIGR03067 family)
MNRVVAPAVLAAGLLLLTHAAAGPADPKDARNIQGTWMAVSLESGGKTIKPPEEMKLRITADKLEPVGKDDPAAYKLGTDGKLRTIDITPDKNKDKTMLGLYELDGDTLKLCFSQGPERLTRPKELTSQGDYAIMTLKRVKEEPKKDK